MEKKSERISLVTFNIRTDTPEDGILNKVFDWSNRVTYVKKLFQEYQWDVAGLQEVRKHQLNDLLTMEEYDFVGENRWNDEWGEYNPILYKKEKYTLLMTDTFWLSKTPKESSNAVYWGAKTPRICTIAHFKVNDSGKEFIVANTHFDHIGEEARYQASKIIMQEINNIMSDLPVFLMGDFNGDQEGRWYTTISKTLTNVITVSPHHVGPLVTCTGVAFRFQPSWDEMTHIDFIFTNEKVMINKTTTVTDQFSGIYPSDHFPVSVIVEI